MTMQLELSQSNLQPWGNSDRSLLEMANKLSGGKIALPPHQRQADAWSKNKKQNWIQRIRKGTPSVGCFITYQISDSDGRLYINDGLQRLNAVVEYLRFPGEYGDSIDVANENCDRYQVTVQHRIYRSHDEALIDFQEINLGTKLTPYEFCHGILTYMPEYDLVWKNVFDRLHSSVEQSTARMVVRGRSNKREREQTSRRNDLALFYRFITRDKTQRRYWSPKKSIEPSEVIGKHVIEWLIRDKLLSIGPKEAVDALERFIKLVERETALYETLWHSNGNRVGTGISNGLYRFMLDVAIWTKNVGIPYKVYLDFCNTIIVRSGGSGKIQDRDNPRKHFTCGMDSLNSLKTLCHIIKDNSILGDELKKKKIETNVKPGYDRSHILPQCIFGDGDVIPLPGGINRSDGARPIQAEFLE